MQHIFCLLCVWRCIQSRRSFNGVKSYVGVDRKRVHTHSDNDSRDKTVQPISYNTVFLLELLLLV
jgi:hypothetical protein